MCDFEKCQSHSPSALPGPWKKNGGNIFLVVRVGVSRLGRLS